MDDKGMKVLEDLNQSFAEARETIMFLQKATISSEILPVFFDIVNDLLVVIDTNKRFVRVSKSWEREFGWETREMEGNLFTDFVHPDDRDTTSRAAVKYNFEQNGLHDYYYNRYLTKDGESRWVQWNPNDDGYKSTGFILGVARVITDAATIAILEAESLSNHGEIVHPSGSLGV